MRCYTFFPGFFGIDFPNIFAKALNHQLCYSMFSLSDPGADLGKLGADLPVAFSALAAELAEC